MSQTYDILEAFRLRGALLSDLSIKYPWRYNNKYLWVRAFLLPLVFFFYMGSAARLWSLIRKTFSSYQTYVAQTRVRLVNTSSPGRALHLLKYWNLGASRGPDPPSDAWWFRLLQTWKNMILEEHFKKINPPATLRQNNLKINSPGRTITWRSNVPGFSTAVNKDAVRLCLYYRPSKATKNDQSPRQGFVDVIAFDGIIPSSSCHTTASNSSLAEWIPCRCASCLCVWGAIWGGGSFLGCSSHRISICKSL